MQPAGPIHSLKNSSHQNKKNQPTEASRIKMYQKNGSISIIPRTYPHQFVNHQPELSPYIEQIWKVMQSNQSKFKKHAKTTPFTISTEINKLILMHQAMGLKQQTLFLTFSYFIEFLGKKMVQENERHLAGVACLWIASKFEEIYAPQIRFFLKFVKQFSLQKLKAMEARVLQCLQFKLVRSTPYNFLQALCQQGSNVFCLSNYLIQSCYYTQSQMIQNPAILAVAAYIISQQLFKDKSKGPDLERMIGYQKEKMELWFEKLCQILQPSFTNSFALRQKFAQFKYKRVSKIHLILK